MAKKTQSGMDNTGVAAQGPAQALRKQAEQIAREKAAQSPETIMPLSPEETRQSLHELRVHQIELEMQNEELRRAQAELEAARASYFDLYDLAPVGYVTLSEQGLILEANLIAATLLGVARSALVKQRLTSFILSEDQDIYYRHRQQLLETGAPQVYELRLIQKDAAPFWVRVDATMAPDPSTSSPRLRSLRLRSGQAGQAEQAGQGADSAPYCRVVLSDITKRKKMDAVRDFLAKYSGSAQDEGFFALLAQYLAETLDMDFICIDRLEGDGLTARTVAVWCDGKFEDNLSYALKDTPCGEVVGKAVCCFPANVCQFFPHDQVLQDLRADSYVGVTLFDHTGQPIGLIAVIGRRPLANRPLAEDILQLVALRAAGEMERLDAEEALQESEKAARRLTQESELIGEIGRIISSTLNIEEVYERFAEKVREAIPFDRITVNTVNLQDYTRTIRYVKGDRFSGVRSGEVFSLAGTGTEQLVRTKSSLLVTSKNREDMIRKFPGISSLLLGAQSTMMIPLISKDEVIGALAVYSAKMDAYSENDLFFAERVGLQIAGAIANAQLFLERKQAEEERRILSDHLQRAEKMEAVGTLAGGVAHDMNNVLGVLMGYSELLVERIPEGNPLRQYATHILKSTEKAAAIVQDLLTLTRRGVVVTEVVDFNSIVTTLQTSPEFDNVQARHPQVNFKTDLEKDLLNIKGSPFHLEKAVLNLMANGAEAIVGSGEVQIRTENRYLDQAVRGHDEIREGDYVVLMVSDSGRGIPADDLDKIFEPFYTKKKMGRSGTGLGLAIVWGTVKDHEGYIDLQSSEGKGTTFTLYFPVTREKMSEDVQKIPIEQYLSQGEAVLVVDDVQEQRQVATTLLVRLGYQVNAVASGEEAVEYLKNNKADILILDMIMDPGIDGLETYKRILAINPHQKAIIVSGFSETERAKEVQKLGAGAYVKKPYVMEKIGLAIRDELNR